MITVKNGTQDNFIDYECQLLTAEACGLVTAEKRGATIGSLTGTLFFMFKAPT